MLTIKTFIFLFIENDSAVTEEIQAAKREEAIELFKKSHELWKILTITVK